MIVTHREIGVIPGCRPPQSTPTLLEQLGIRNITPEQAVKEWSDWCRAQYAQGREPT